MLADRIRMSHRKKVDIPITEDNLINLELPIKGENGYTPNLVGGGYLINAGSYSGIRLSYFTVTEPGIHRVHFDYASDNNTGWWVILKDGAGAPVFDTNGDLGLEANAIRWTSFYRSFNASAAGKYALLLLRRAATGTVEYKLDSIRITKE